MSAAICVVCGKPILPTEGESTVEQVDVCTMARERVSYHSTCLDQSNAAKPAPRGAPRPAPERGASGA